jgi:hypothetical protein
VVVAVRAILVGIFKLFGIFSEALLALFAREDHLVALEEFMVFALLVTFCAVEPFATCKHNQRCSYYAFDAISAHSSLIPQLFLSTCAFKPSNVG